MNRFYDYVRRIAGYSVVKSSAVVMAGSMIANVLAYAYHLIVGRILGPEGYGELAALFSLFYILNVPSTVVQTVLTKFFTILRAKNKHGEVRSLFFLSLLILLVLAAVGLGFVSLSVNSVASFLHIKTQVNFYWLYFIFVLYFVGMVPTSLMQTYQLFFAQSTLSALGMALRLLFAAVSAPFGVTWTLASNIGANIISLVAYIIPLRPLLKAKSAPISLLPKRALGYSIPTVLTTLAVAALYNQDVLLVKHFFPPVTAGIYSSLSVLGKIIFYASSAITFVLFPVIAERKELARGHTRLVYTSLLSVAGLSAGLTILYFLFPEAVVHMLYGSSYEGAIPYVGLFGVFISFFALDNMLISICLAAEKVKVWIFGLAAAVAQFAIIWLYHATLGSIIVANIAIVAVLFVVLLIYYAHGKE